MSQSPPTPGRQKCQSRGSIFLLAGCNSQRLSVLRLHTTTHDDALLHTTSTPCVSSHFPPVPVEELCTLVITEAFPEDSGLFKCVALNSFGTVSCSAVLQVLDGLTLISPACRPATFSSGPRSLFDLPVLPCRPGGAGDGRCWPPGGGGVLAPPAGGGLSLGAARLRHPAAS